MKKAVTFGEIMLRLQPPGHRRIVQTDLFEATFGGGEANVAVSLANYGIEAGFVTKIPKNLVGDACLNSLRRFGVDTSHIVRGGERLGIYFCEKGASQRASNVIYDRAGASIASASKADFNWEKIFEGAQWFHFTGITPALSDSMAEITLEAAKKAREMGLTVSCDLNYRKKLWSKEKAGKVMSELMPFVNLLIANEEDSADVFGIHAPGTDITGGQISADGYKNVISQLVNRFGFDKVAITLRESISASQNGWSAMLWDQNEFYQGNRYLITVIDRVGGGDSFGGGLIYSYLTGKNPQEAVNFAVAASCLKHTIEGDFNAVSAAEVESLAAGDGSGRVSR